MQLLVITLVVLAQSVNAFWDAGHMLVGQVAKSYLEPLHYGALEALLQRWDEQFPNTGDLATATVWADLLKCKKEASYCPSVLMPSVGTFDEFHYSGLSVQVRGDNEFNLTMFDDADGKAHIILEDTLKTFLTSKSTWSANLMLRFMLHTFGDVHQPLHTTSGVSADFPNGDRGGNSYKFRKPCAHRNLHMLWDATAGVYNYGWNTTMSKELRQNISQDALDIIRDYPVHDKLNFSVIDDMPYKNFTSYMKENDLVRQAILESAQIGHDVVYGPLDLSIDDEGYAACPTEEYIENAKQLSPKLIHLGGFRLSFILRQLAQQALDMQLVTLSFK